MSVERVYTCDGPICEREARTGESYAPIGWLDLIEDGAPRHFCSWDCLLRFGNPPAEQRRAIFSLVPDGPDEAA